LSIVPELALESSVPNDKKKDSLISDIWVFCQERVIWQEFADRFAVRCVMRDANLSLQEMVLNFWISLVLAVTTVSYERRSLNVTERTSLPSNKNI
jgi:hypothetical protein